MYVTVCESISSDTCHLAQGMKEECLLVSIEPWGQPSKERPVTLCTAKLSNCLLTRLRCFTFSEHGYKVETGSENKLHLTTPDSGRSTRFVKHESGNGLLASDTPEHEPTGSWQKVSWCYLCLRPRTLCWVELPTKIRVCVWWRTWGGGGQGVSGSSFCTPIAKEKNFLCDLSTSGIFGRRT